MARSAESRAPAQEAPSELVAAIGSVLRSIAQAPFELDAVLEEMCRLAVGLCAAEFGTVYLRDGDVSRFAAGAGGNEALRAWERDHPDPVDRRTVTGRVVLDGQPVLIPDVRADPEYATDALGLVEYRTLLGVPLRDQGEVIGSFGLARTTVRPFSDDEIDVVTLFADQAAIAIRIERQRTELARFAPQVASLLSTDEGEQLLAGHRREITAMFCDLRGFTAFAETAEPEEVFGVLREYHAAVGELAVANGGTVEHFAGDGLMVFFNDPARIVDHPMAAVRTALAIRERFDELATQWRKRGYELGLGIGLALGYATLGRIGFEGRYDYGGIGNVVILASRLSDKAVDGEILLSQRVHAAVEEHVSAEPVEPLELKGISRPVPAFRVRGVGAAGE